ncbi:hypothetical protein [Streptomyces sp. S.PB5]|uniref:hypothetical protein n=1 Tax=Streptomyces sp. S.PB5 TaxID=3020844 RepID=UPI0025B1289C|nr:hypothetical protein [Streptomyces sp. S.PB5]MDN3023271.1 hypothetical protein [Streptomyces sp. S.PB5]
MKAPGQAQAAAAKQRATPDEKAARTLTKATRPAPRYLIGQDARALSFLRLLPAPSEPVRST